MSKLKFRKYLVAIVCLLTIFFMVNNINASAATKNPEINFKQKVLHSVVYYEVTNDKRIVDDAEKYNEKIYQQYEKLNENDLKNIIKQKLVDVIELKKQNKNIYWDKDFIETVVKSYYPELYSEIIQQISEQPEVILEETYVPAFVTASPGSKTEDFQVYGYHWSGYKLWAFICRMYWSWDSTKITEVEPTTWGEIYDPTWGYDGVVANQQYFIDQASFYKWVKGHFYWPLQQIIAGHAYPWLEITVYAGGGYSFNKDDGLN
ncbi:hypothetical protein [Neomoorella humiferrea]|uniref:hypothetical protein n=1 Tax=Neomoorella humiferrea TaxID=676965 RepID=UPI0030CAF769